MAYINFSWLGKALVICLGAFVGMLCLILLIFVVVWVWRCQFRHRTMSRGYCAVQTLCGLFLKCIYRIKVRGVENIPDTGGVLLIANHVAYVDVLLVGVLSPRPVRFLSWEGFEHRPVMRFLTRTMGTIPVSESKAKDAIQKSAEALKAGEVVCIFPEGSITRNGAILPLRKGFELIARRAETPIVPLAIDGMWGSWFSFSGGKSFKKIPPQLPRPVSVVFGRAFNCEEHASTRLRILELASEAFAMRPALEGHLGREVATGLARKGGRVALIDRTSSRREFGGATLLALSWAFAAQLKRRTRSTRVAIVLPPGIAAAVANLGCILAGKVPVNLNFSLGREQALSCMQRAEVDLVISAAAFRKKLAEKFPDFPFGDKVYDVAEFLMTHPRVDLVWRIGLVRALPKFLMLACLGLPKRGGDAEAALLFTSGSSGQPKGVRLSHRNLLANFQQIDDSSILPPHAVLLSNLPVFHSFGFTVGLWYALSRSPCLVTLPSPLDTSAAIKAIEEEKVTVVVGTPTFLRPYLRRATQGELASLKYAVVGSEKCPEDLVESFAERLDTQILEGYGITETSPVLSVNVPDRADIEAPNGVWIGNVRGSVGRPVVGLAVRFIEPNTEAILPHGQTGLLEVRGANVFMGYLDTEQTAKAMTADGWYRTGDLAKLDGDGFLHILGRLSRFSKIGGEMVPHGTVEDALRKVLGLNDSAVLKVAVASCPDALKGEQLVVLHVDELDPEAIRVALAAEGFANLWIPKVFKRIPEIPILGTGKLDLSRLRELAMS